MDKALPHLAGELDCAALDRAIDERAEDAFTFLGRLVRVPSVLGQELAGQLVVAEELERLGFEVGLEEIDESIAADPLAGIPQRAYAGRPLVVGRRGGSAARSLLLNGHIDVVPPGDSELWSADPFEPVRRDGWLQGRGAADMKAGFAMIILALGALEAAAPATPRGPLAVVSVIEEECTGNGTLAAVRGGLTADAVLLPECTGLDILLGGAGITWFELVVRSGGAHAATLPEGASAIDSALELVAALSDLEDELNAGDESAPDGERYRLNVGTFHAGDWQSTVPALARLGCRLAYPRTWPPARAEERVREVVAGVASSHPWLSRHPPLVRFNGFRAEGHQLDATHPLVDTLATAHAHAHGSFPARVTGVATTDARYYLNQLGVPVVCYGPRPRNLHGIDEAVELESIVAGARTLARFIAAWFASEECVAP